MANPSSSIETAQGGGPSEHDDTDPIQVVVSVWGRFHGFDLARELQSRRALASLITSYPTFAVSRFGVDPSRVHSRPMGEVAARAGRRWPAVGELLNTNERARDLYVRQARRALRRIRGDVFVGWSGSSLPLLRDAKDRGMVTVLERGSAHIVEQTELLVQEYAKWGLRFGETPQMIIDREQAEYEVADYIAVPSQFVRRSFIDRGVPEQKLLVNPYGGDLSAFRPGRNPHDKFRILQVGQVSIRKGFRYVIEAFQAADIPNSELVFVGAISPAAQAYLDENRPAGVISTGSVPFQDLPSAYAEADIFCLGSIEEGLALVLLQGAASGLPIVCTTNTGGDDVIGHDAGVVVPPADTQALAEAFTLLYGDEALRAQMGRAARQRVEAAFSWEHYGERALGHYRKIVDGRP